MFSRKLSHGLVTLAVMSAVSTGAMAEPTTEDEKYGYAVGFMVASQLKQQFGESVNVDMMLNAISDVLKGKETALNQDEVIASLQNHQKKEAEAQAQLSADRQAQGATFMQDNAKRDEVKITDSNIQYEILKEGAGEKPTLSDNVLAHYHGTHIDGSVFDSSYDRGTPASFPISGLIKGWQEILPMMPTGSKWRIVVPPEMAYGAAGSGAIGPNETLIFDIELLEIK